MAQKRLKIGVLTQPLHNNYGGLLQAYALKEVLQQMGHSVVIINRRPLKDRFTTIHKIAVATKSLIKLKSPHPNLFLSKSYHNAINHLPLLFQKKYIPNLSKMVVTQKGMRNLNRQGFECYIVGSDQCWRPRYSPKLLNYFLDFAKQKEGIKKLSYAASFGTERWEFTPKESIRAAELLAKFNWVSVREEQAVQLVKEHLKRDDAKHLPDPTLLLNKEHYLKLIEEYNGKSGPDKLHHHIERLHRYILDNNRQKEQLVDRVATLLKLTPQSLLPTKSLYHTKVTIQNLQQFSYRSPIEWLQATAEATFVVTDSFHGTLFAILFNTPFITIANRERGAERMQSLLKKFNLQERLVELDSAINSDEPQGVIDRVVALPIEWSEVNRVIAQERKKGIEFLEQI